MFGFLPAYTHKYLQCSVLDEDFLWILYNSVVLETGTFSGIYVMHQNMHELQWWDERKVQNFSFNLKGWTQMHSIFTYSAVQNFKAGEEKVFEGTRLVGRSKHLGELSTDLVWM